MQRKKLARFTAMALAAIMTLGGAITAMASDATSGTTTGEGTNEGHLNKEVVEVVLPTVSEGSTPFAYTMDLERLIQETNGAKYAEDVTFPAKAGDTGVYFNVSGNYANESEELEVINKSSVSINLTVEVAATKAATDVALVSSNSFTGDDAQLYLALKVGDEAATPVVAGDKVSSTVTILGIADNFKAGVDEDNNYVYAPIESPAPWKTATFCMIGAASKASAEGLTAPTLTVTWRYENPNAAEGGIFYDKKTNDWWFGLTTDNGFTKGIDLGAVTVNGQPIKGTVTEFEGEDWVLIKWNDYKAAGYDQTETEFDFTVVVNGTTYTAHYTYK